MSRFLDRLQQRQAGDGHSSQIAENEQLRKCIENLPHLTSAIIDYFEQAEPEQAVRGFQEVSYRGERYAGWSVYTWPNFDLPHDVEVYSVHLLDNKQLVSQTKRWYQEPVFEQYDPHLYATETSNAQSIYTAMLPFGDHHIETEYRARIE